MILGRIMKLLRSNNLEERRSAWALVWEKRTELDITEAALADLETFASDEPDLQIGMVASHVVERLRKNPKPCLQQLLWAPFGRGHEGRGSAREAAVIAVNDDQYIPDAFPLLNLVQWIPNPRDVKLKVIRFERPQWDGIQFAHLRACCLVGRPGMFRGSGLVAAIPNDLRFGFPGGDRIWRGRPVTTLSRKKYHFLEQRWKNQITTRYEVTDKQDKTRKVKYRVDYAVVQRYPVTFGLNQVTVMVLAGLTSLGTAGAVLWATQLHTDAADLNDFDLREGSIGDKTRMEVLLEVTADHEFPRRPWTPQVKELKVFINGTPNLVAPAPSVIRLTGGSAGPSGVTGIFFDDDGIELDASGFSALVALCLKSHRLTRGAAGAVVDVQDLIKDGSVWPGGSCGHDWSDWRPALRFYLDKFQRPGRPLHGCLRAEGSAGVRLDARVVLD